MTAVDDCLLIIFVFGAAIIGLYLKGLEPDLTPELKKAYWAILKDRWK